MVPTYADAGGAAVVPHLDDEKWMATDGLPFQSPLHLRIGEREAQA
jgi:hypothetical protein